MHDIYIYAQPGINQWHLVHAWCEWILENYILAVGFTYQLNRVRGKITLASLRQVCSPLTLSPTRNQKAVFQMLHASPVATMLE